MILKNVKFCSYINTSMTRKSINWLDSIEQAKYQDMDLQWMTNANQNRAMERHHNLNQDLKFWDQSDDTEQNFQKLINQGIPNYWRFHNDEVIYRFNSFGFRAPEFDTVDWKDSYIILGCSHVLGIGNPYEETIGQYISKELNHPVINMGVGGASMAVIYNNLLKLIKDYGKPRGVFILWSYPTRQLRITDYFVFEDRDNWIKPFWGRNDIIPGNPENKKVLLDDEYFNKCFYDRSIYIESTKQILHDIPLSMIADAYCWMLDCHIKSGIDNPKIIVPVPEEFKKQLQNYHKQRPAEWSKTTDECKKWYLNEIKARDILRYNKQGPDVSHWGRLVNEHVAKKLVKNLNETTTQQD